MLFRSDPTVVEALEQIQNAIKAEQNFASPKPTTDVLPRKEELSRKRRTLGDQRYKFSSLSQSSSPRNKFLADYVLSFDKICDFSPISLPSNNDSSNMMDFEVINVIGTSHVEVCSLFIICSYSWYRLVLKLFRICFLLCSYSVFFRFRMLC